MRIASLENSRQFSCWAKLYQGYAEFYQHPPLSNEHLNLVWSWLTDPKGPIYGLCAYDDNNAMVGLAHLRPFARPLSGCWGLFLDDLYTEPKARGQGIGKALINAASCRAANDGQKLMRWITAEDNNRARALYDTVAQATTWITYDTQIEPAP